MRRHQVRKKQQLDKAMLTRKQEADDTSDKPASNQQDLLVNWSRALRDVRLKQPGEGRVLLKNRTGHSLPEETSAIHRHNNATATKEAVGVLKKQVPVKLVSLPQPASLSLQRHSSPGNNSVCKQQSKLSNSSSKASSSANTSSQPSSTSLQPDPTLSPEILFLVKKHAEAIDRINQLEKRIEQMERKSQNSVSTAEAQMLKTSPKSEAVLRPNSAKLTCKDNRNLPSDDSGGEFSRATVSDEDDELSSLLDQIAKYSKQIHQNQQAVTNCSLRSSHSIPAPLNPFQKTSMYSLPAESHFKTQPNFAYQRKISSKPIPCNESSQPISALLFDPNVNNVLQNLDTLIDDDKPISASTNFCRSLSAQQPIYYDEFDFNATGVRRSCSVAVPNPASESSQVNWHMERMHQLIKQKQQQELESQLRLSDQWLADQLDGGSKDQPQRLSHFIDSLEPSTFR